MRERIMNYELRIKNRAQNYELGIGRRIMNYELGIKDGAGATRGREERARNSLFIIRNSRARGFSLLETLVALAILTAAVTGPMNLATVSIRSASLAHNNIIASFLAEEGMEIVRAGRDRGAYAGDWLANIGICEAQDCKVDAINTDAPISSCGGIGTCPKIQYESASGSFRHDTGSNSIFTRSVRITKVGDGSKEIVVTVIVSWKERFLPQDSKVTITTNLSNWK
jgi:prepilin-type N-terminal cleavage/methylation domain-containing protein